jgi:hypothetical protein
LVHKIYIVDSDAKFDIVDYPEIADELTIIKKQLVNDLPSMPYTEMIISYLTTHSVKKEYVLAKSLFMDKLIAFSRNTVHIEALFAACKMNKVFLNAFETHLRNVLS